jgi:hypothetical protein
MCECLCGLCQPHSQHRAVNGVVYKLEIEQLACHRLIVLPVHSVCVCACVRAGNSNHIAMNHAVFVDLYIHVIFVF